VAFLPNPGKLPRECVVLDDEGSPTGKYRRVIVKLRNGTILGREPVTTVAPRGWDPRTTRWTHENHVSDVLEFKVI
jgi:hypothetical protein